MTDLEMSEFVEQIRKSCDRVAYTTREAADAIGVSVPTMHKLLHTADFPAYKIGGKVFVDAAGFRAWSAANATDRVGLR